MIRVVKCVNSDVGANCEKLRNHKSIRVKFGILKFRHFCPRSALAEVHQKSLFLNTEYSPSPPPPLYLKTPHLHRRYHHQEQYLAYSPPRCRTSCLLPICWSCSAGLLYPPENTGVIEPWGGAGEGVL